MKKVVLTVILVILAILIVGYFMVSSSYSAKFIYLDQEKRVKPVLSDNADSLPNDLVISPGIYKVGGFVYKFKEEGLYRFKNGEQRIVYEKDPKAILTSLAWLDNSEANTFKGSTKKSESFSGLANTEFNLSCGKLSELAVDLLKKQNLEARIALGFDPSYDWNDNSDNGHTIFELKINDRWQVFDLDNNATFKKNGKYLNFWELYQSITNNEAYELEYLAFGKQSRSEADLRKYYKDTIKVPFLSNGTFLFFTASGEDLIKTKNYSRRYKLAEHQNWLDRFYPGYGYK